MRLLRALLLATLLLGLTSLLTRAEADEKADGNDVPDDVDGEGEASEDEEDEEKEVKEKTDEITEEKDVMVLHIKNFERALRENKFLLVEFYAPWCGHCRQLEPVYAQAATQLKSTASAARLAKVDATEEKELAEEFDVQSFPTLKFFTHGQRQNASSYTGKRTADGIVQWLNRRMGPSATSLETTDGTQEFIDANNVTVVGFFQSLDSEAVKVFFSVAMDVVDLNFGIVNNPDILKHFGLEEDTLVLFKKFDDRRVDLPVPEKLEKDDVVSFIRDNALELVIQFNEQNAEKIFGSKVHNHILLFLNTSLDSHNALLADYRTAAGVFKGKILFILIDVTGSVSHVLKYFGLSESDSPAVRLINTDTVKKYAPTQGSAINTNTLQAFCQGVLDGSVQPHLMSQEVPSDWDQKPLKVLVGKNFESVVFDESKNVFVEFYAPWCGHCKELAPIWEQLAEKYKERDDIIIAHMDATANEVETISVSGFPTLKYFPAGTERKVVDYNGKRDLETFSKFLDSGGVLPEEPEDEEEQEEDEEEDEEEDDEEQEDDNDEDQVTDDSPKKNDTTKDEL